MVKHQKFSITGNLGHSLINGLIGHELRINRVSGELWPHEPLVWVASGD